MSPISKIADLPPAGKHNDSSQKHPLNPETFPLPATLAPVELEGGGADELSEATSPSTADKQRQGELCKWTFPKLLRKPSGQVILANLYERGFTDATIDLASFGCYLDKAGKLKSVIPISNEDGVVQNWRVHKQAPHWLDAAGNPGAGFKVQLYPLETHPFDRGNTQTWPALGPNGIVICEGELDCRLLHQFGIRAVTGTGGAGTWKGPEFNEHFRGWDVILAYDNDEAGQEGQTKVLQSLYGIAKSLRYVNWPDGTPEKYDVGDWLSPKEGHSFEELELVDYTPPAQAEDQALTLPAQAGELKVWSFAELLQAYQPTRWLVEGIMPVGGIGMLAGKPSIGKSWLALDLALAVSTGRNWLGKFPCQRCLELPVLVVLAEESGNDMVERLTPLLRGQDLDNTATTALHFLFNVQICDKEGQLDGALVRAVQQIQPALVVFDPLRDLHPLEENDSRQMSRLFQALRQLTRLTAEPCSIILAHHLRKMTGFDGDQETIRGSTAIAGALDSLLEIGGEFKTLLQVKQTKSKRGPTVNPFMIATHLEPGETFGSVRSLRLSYLDRAAKSAEDLAAVAESILTSLQTGPMIQSELVAAVKAVTGVGDKRIMGVLDEGVAQGRLVKEKGGRNASVYRMNPEIELVFPTHGGVQN